MKCSDIKGLLLAYSNNELPLTQKEFLEEHLKHCLDCRATLADYYVVRERLANLKTDISVPDITEETMAKVKNIRVNRRNTSWIYALAGVSAITIILLVLLVQPWQYFLGSQNVLAKTITAMENIKSYRSYSSPGVIFTGPNGIQYKGNYKIERYSEPDKFQLEININGSVDEYIFIGDQEYYLINSGTTFEFSQAPLYRPNKDDTIDRILSISNLHSLSDGVIDGINCFHYQGTDIRNLDSEIDLWVGKQDYLVRQEIERPKISGLNTYVSTTNYYDINEENSINPPIDLSGNLLSGWKMKTISTQTYPGNHPTGEITISTSNTTQ